MAARMKSKSERGYIAAEVDRLTNGWTSTLTSPNYDLKDLSVLQARAREELKNNAYVQRFVNMVRNNTVGPDGGFRLQVKSVTTRGEPDKLLNDMVEAQWRRWGRKGTCDVTARYTFHDLQNLVVTGLVVDGEAFVRRIRNWNGNEWGYALQFIDPARVPATHNNADANIQLSIESDQWGAPVAYHIAKRAAPSSIPFSDRRQEFDRIPADEILHFYLPDLANQDRGVPALASCLRDLNMLRGYQEAELVAARQHANQVGFFERDPNAATGFVGDGNDDLGNVYMDSEPGEWRELPAGLKANWIDPAHPNQAYKDFVKAMLRSIASALSVNSNTLAGDLEGVNYSSLRQGALEERETWKCLQTHVRDHFLQVVYEDWLTSALGRGKILTGGRPPEQQRDKLLRVNWQPRRWEWVDPVKNEQAHALAIQNNTRSVSQIIREQGHEPDEVFAEIAAERERMAELGITAGDVLAAIEPDEELDE